MYDRKKIIILITIIVLAVISLLLLEKSGKTNLYTKKSTNFTSDAKTSSTEASAQPDFQDGDPDKKPGNSIKENEGSATLTDTKGSIIVQNSKPIVSKTGQISVNSPSSGQLIESGDIISGTSSLQVVSFRIIDDVSGMISSGEISVKDGKFSGKLGFSTSGSKGRIDIFASNSDGSEYSGVEIDVRFK